MYLLKFDLLNAATKRSSLRLDGGLTQVRRVDELKVLNVPINLPK